MEIYLKQYLCIDSTGKTITEKLTIMNEAGKTKSKFESGRQEILKILSLAEDELNQLSGVVGHKLEDANAILQKAKVIGCCKMLCSFLLNHSFKTII